MSNQDGDVIYRAYIRQYLNPSKIITKWGFTASNRSGCYSSIQTLKTGMSNSYTAGVTYEVWKMHVGLADDKGISGYFEPKYLYTWKIGTGTTHVAQD